ncbi:MAG: TonB family protein [Myxococcales bacterium]|nr:TonB family protein [Myxococcales bacterium]
MITILLPLMLLSQPEVGSQPVELIAPVLTSTPSIQYPPDAPKITESVMVQVELTISQTGTVANATVITSGGPAFDRATIKGVQQLVFRPATENSIPIEVIVPYKHHFEPPSPEPTVEMATLEGELYAQGIRQIVPFATILVETSTHTQMMLANKKGRFSLNMSPGTVNISVRNPGFRPFQVIETLEANERLKVRYLLEPAGLNPYDITVYADRQRTEIAKTVLRGDELTTIPGTFGDPFRAVSTLPGVAPVLSLLPFPVVRGSSPGNTGFLIDGVRASHLFHLLAGPSVIHPNFIDEIEFHPGTFSVDYGGYTGGIINARSAESRLEDRPRVEVNLNLLESGAYLGHLPLGSKFRASVAGRIGYPGTILSLVQDDTELTYWDYQAKISYGPKTNQLSIFALGARDQLGTGEDNIIFGFHRADLKHVWRGSWFESQSLVSFVTDETQLGSFNVKSYLVVPRLRFTLFRHHPISFRIGFDGQLRDSKVANISNDDDDDDDDDIFSDTGDPISDTLLIGGVLLESLWRPTPRSLIRAGIRSDIIDNRTDTLYSFDPRILFRYGFGKDPNAPSFSIKGGLGIYHQPPRPPIPIPGLAEIALDQKLQRAIQSSVGFEAQIAELFLDVKGYYNYLDPLILDLSINQDFGAQANPGPTSVPGEPPDVSLDEEDTFSLDATRGRSYGLEFLIRRESKTGVFGWLSYTLSRSERDAAEGTRPADFDRTHVLNLVAGFRLPRGWQLGFRSALFSGRPITTELGTNEARTNASFRFDFRVDKTAVYRNWIFNFYVDVRNALVSPEEVSNGTELTYVLPTLGLRAIF